MKIYIVSEMDERDESLSSGPCTAHITEARAKHVADQFNNKLRGKADEAGHYAQVFAIELDLTADGMELQRLRDEVIRQQSRMARGRRS